MGIKYIIRSIVDFINMKSNYYRSGVTLFFLPLYTEFSTQKWGNMNFEKRIRENNTHPVILYSVPSNFK
jgi:hypothetical protein